MNKFIALLKQYNKQIVCFGIFAVAMYLRILKRINLDLWTDECQQFHHTNFLKPFWRKISHGDHSVFPGEYLLNFPFTKIFGYHKWGLAIPHIIITILGFYLLYKFCSRYYRTIWAYIIAFVVVCFNNTMIFHAFEYRPYAVLPTLVLGSLYFSEIIVTRYHELKRYQKIWIGIFFVVATKYHAYGIMMAFGPAVYAVMSYRKGELRDVFTKDYVKYFFVVALIAMPIWFWYASFNTFGLAPLKVGQTIADPFDYIPNPIFDFVGFTKGIVGNLMGGTKKLYFLLIGIAMTFLLPHKDRMQQLGFLLVLVVLPLVAIIFVDVKCLYWFLQRQFIWIMPLFAFFLGWCWDSCICYTAGRLRRKTAA